MPQSLSKVTKKVMRKKGRITGLHERSRDARKLHKAAAREDRVQRLTATKSKQEEAYVQRIAFFQAALIDLESEHSILQPTPITKTTTTTTTATGPDSVSNSPDTTMDTSAEPATDRFGSRTLCSLVTRYLDAAPRPHPTSAHFTSAAAAAETIPQSGPTRPPRPRTAAEDRAVLRRESGRREFDAGFWMPDLRDAAGRTALREWRGDWAGMHALHFVRVDRRGHVQPSGFPPRGGV